MTNTMACRRGRPPGPTANRIAKRYIIAGALLAGLTVAAVARQLGVSRSWASREANAPGTRVLIAELLEAHREQLNELFSLTLDLIEAAFQARKIFLVGGVLVDGGPDHYARLEAARLFIRLISSRREGGATHSSAPGHGRDRAARCPCGQRRRRGGSRRGDERGSSRAKRNTFSVWPLGI